MWSFIVLSKSYHSSQCKSQSKAISNCVNNCVKLQSSLDCLWTLGWLSASLSFNRCTCVQVNLNYGLSLAAVKIGPFRLLKKKVTVHCCKSPLRIRAHSCCTVNAPPRAASFPQSIALVRSSKSAAKFTTKKPWICCCKCWQENKQIKPKKNYSLQIWVCKKLQSLLLRNFPPSTKFLLSHELSSCHIIGLTPRKSKGLL